MSNSNAEQKRLDEANDGRAAWRRWGPYLSERAWGTVREDYSANGDAWNYFPHDHARSRAYRWSEDGLAGICDEQQQICFALALWNGRDPILKERAFGLTGTQGNHGEDLKEYYYYLDSTPTHSYMKYLYKYPQVAFPYEELIAGNARRGKQDPEYELIDTGVFDESRYFDVFVEYAKAAPDDILIEITAHNRGPAEARLDLLPTIWFRNVWAWDEANPKPSLLLGSGEPARIELVVHQNETAGRLDANRQESTAQHRVASPHLYEPRRRVPGHVGALVQPRNDTRYLYFSSMPGVQVLFTENDTNAERLYGVSSASPYVKDAFHEYVIHQRIDSVNPAQRGTKAAPHYTFQLAAGESARVRLRLTDSQLTDPLGAGFDDLVAARRREADEFYETIIPATLSIDEHNTMRQALAGLLWSKQYYHYQVRRWLQGDPKQPPPPASRWGGRNNDWVHLYNADVISMPDKWEFPWYASWDLAFQCIALALVDVQFAKDQLLLMLREWYMYPNGQIPAYEWNFSDVNPPVHAWAAERIYDLERRRTGQGDRAWLERVFQKLLLNFTWWVNRKDAEANNLFQGGFLGLDNIGLFDRNVTLPPGFVLEQSDGTSWMAMFCVRMLSIALELANENPVYQDMAIKFFEHAYLIAGAMNSETSAGLWNEEDGFFYDHLHTPDGRHIPVPTRTMVGLTPLFAVATAEAELLKHYPKLAERLQWIAENRPDLTDKLAVLDPLGTGQRALLALVRPGQLRRILRYVLDENEFLSPYGLRGVSKIYEAHPLVVDVQGYHLVLNYAPGESTDYLFGGNSNWRGPIWLPLNYLVIESLEVFHIYFGDQFKVECPTGSGQMMTLGEVAGDLSRRLGRIYARDQNGRRAVFGGYEIMQSDPHWRDCLLFHEYFHGDNGSGRGASHQTGWTGLIANVLQKSADNEWNYSRQSG